MGIISMAHSPCNTALFSFGHNATQRVMLALQQLRKGGGVLLLDDEDRENEGDLIFAAQHLTHEQMALMIRECSGIVCLCLSEKRCKQLNLKPMVEENNSPNHTAFTVSIEAAQGITTGVSAADRVTTIKAAIADNATASDLSRPGHVFPLAARNGGVLERRGHTEGTLELMRLAELKHAGVLCEVTNPDGTMARFSEIIAFSKRYNMPVLTIEDIVSYIVANNGQSA